MAKTLRILAIGLTLGIGAACARDVDVDRVPVGADLQVTRQDGVLVEGRLAARDAERVQLSTGAVTKSVPRAEIVDVRVVEPGAGAPPPPLARFREVTVPRGTELAIELASAVHTGTSRRGDAVQGTLAESLVIDGIAVAPAGSAVGGDVAAVQPAGKVKGRASVALEFASLTAHGESYAVSARFEAVAPATKRQDARTIGIPAAGGAVLGAILGGGKGAAVGAAVGGGAGAAAVLMTAGEEISLPAGTTVSVALTRAVDVKVPIR